MRKKARLDMHRPLPADTVRRLNDDLRVTLTYHSNAIEGNGQNPGYSRTISQGAGVHSWREYDTASAQPGGSLDAPMGGLE